jgi:hypothetical protein
MVAVEVVFAWVQVPAANLLAIDTVKVIVANVAAPVILGQEGTVRLLPRLVLHICGDGVFGKCWQRTIPDVRACVGKRYIVEAPKRSKFAQGRKRVVDEVLVRAMETIVDDPVEFALGCHELDVNPVGALVHDICREPLEVRSRAI